MRHIAERLKALAGNPKERFEFLCRHGFYDRMPDEKYLKKMFEVKMGYPLDLSNPQTFNEKLQWLKLYDRRPEYTMMVDKYAVKQFIADNLGKEYVIPTYGVWDNYDEIDFDRLPDQFVLKCTHDSGGLVIVKDKNNMDHAAARKKLTDSLARDYYLTGREWPYKNVPRRIIAEKYMVDESGYLLKTDSSYIGFHKTEEKLSFNGELVDYKFMCFHGNVQCVFTCSERASDNGLMVTFFDKDWNVLPFERHYPKSNKPIAKPLNFEKMVQFSETLSKGIPFVRVDFYEINQKVYFGELTFYPGNGMEEFHPESADYELGKLIKLEDLK